MNCSFQDKLWHKIDDDKSGNVDLDEFREAIVYMHADVTEAAGRKQRITVTLVGIFGWIGVGGASGGAVQAFYLTQVDTRPEALVMASFVPMPREEKSGGCACDWVPGGWKEDLVSKLDIPSLWMSEGAEPKPDGLGPKGSFVTHSGPHGFERPMIDEAVTWMDSLHSLEIDRLLPDQLPHAPASAWASETIGNASISILLSRPPTSGAK